MKISLLATFLSCALFLGKVCGAEQITLDGSTGMLPLARALAAAYQKQAPDAKLEFGKGLGTGARLRAVTEDKIQIALASHGVDAEALHKGKLKVIAVAKGAIVFAAGANVTVSNISDAQVCDVYNGKLQNWQALGGADEAIAAFTRPPAEVDPEVIREKIACFKDLKEAEHVKVMARGGDMAKALTSTPNALGMTSMTVVEQSGGKVKALALNGIAPTEENVKNGRYVLTREFLFVVREDMPPAVKGFVDFVLSVEGDRILRASGAVPLR